MVTVGVTVGFERLDVKPDGFDVQLYVFPTTEAAPSETDAPLLQMDVLLPPVAAGNGFTVTITEFELAQPVAVIVSTRVYVVVTVGETTGFAIEDVKPLGVDVHAYVRPATAAAPSCLLPPLQIAELVPAFAAGTGLTVTTTEFDFEQPVATTVSVNVYVVVTVGETETEEAFDVKPAGFDVQLYVLPLIAAAPSEAEEPLLQMLVFVPAAAAGSGLTEITTVLELKQPVATIV